MTTITMTTGRKSIDIRGLATTHCGITIFELEMIAPVTGVLTLSDDQPVITLSSKASEVQKRAAIANLLAMCLEEGEKVNAIMTDNPEEHVAKRGRGLLMPKELFICEYNRLEAFGKLRYSIMATLLGVSLGDVLLRMQDLSLDI